MGVNIAAVIERLARFEIERVNALRNFAQRTHEDERNDLSQRADGLNPDDEYLDVLLDERQFLDEVRRLSDQLATVALYRVVELNTLKAARWRWKKKDAAGLYQIDRLRSKLRSELDVELTSLPGFSTIDELRCANNAVKHRGKVSKELAAFPGWIQGADLDGLDALNDRAVTSIPPYLRSLGEVLIPKKTTAS